MKAERKQTKSEFVPVIVTLESQEEVDSLYAVVDHIIITNTLHVLLGWQNKLQYFRSKNYNELWHKLNKIIIH